MTNTFFWLQLCTCQLAFADRLKCHLYQVELSVLLYKSVPPRRRTISLYSLAGINCRRVEFLHQGESILKFPNSNSRVRELATSRWLVGAVDGFDISCVAAMFIVEHDAIVHT